MFDLRSLALNIQILTYSVLNTFEIPNKPNKESFIDILSNKKWPANHNNRKKLKKYSKKLFNNLFFV